MRPFIVLVFTFISITILEAQFFYSIDNDVNAVFPMEENDLEVSSSINFNEHINVQVAYSPINRLSFSSAYYNYNKTIETFDFINSTVNSYSFAIGTYSYQERPSFLNFFPYRKLKGMKFSSKLGFTIGKVENSLISLNGSLSNVNTNYHSFFLRNSYSLEYPRFGFCFQHLFQLLRFDRATLDGTFEFREFILDRSQKDIKKNTFLSQLSMNIYGKAGPIRLFTELNAFLTLDKEKEEALFRNSIFTFGVVVNCSQLFKQI